jgi:transcriptional regulator with XRE-family HTH domain
MSLIKRIEEMKNGPRMLASARFRRQVLQTLDRALEDSGMSQTDLANKLELSRSAVSQVFNGDGNLRAETISDYLFELGMHAELFIVPNKTSETFHQYHGTKEMNVAPINRFTLKEAPEIVKLQDLDFSNASLTKQGVA